MLKIAETDWKAVRAHGEETYPHECCGILLGTMDIDKDEREVQIVVRAGNTRLDALHNRYNIDPKELIAAQKQARLAGLDIVGFYHSHPRSAAEPSPRDVAEFDYPDHLYVIVSLRTEPADVRLFRFVSRNFQPVSFVTVA